MMREVAIILAAGALAMGLGTMPGAAQTANPERYQIDLIPPPHPEFHDRMGGWPTEISRRTFHAASGKLTIFAHADGRTDLTFDFHGLLPLGVYTLWDVVNADFAAFADRPLMNIPAGVDGTQDHWWNAIAFEQDGGPGGFGFGFMADRQGQARVVVNLDHRPGKEFLLDYHADDHVRGGVKGRDVFPGVLWAKFPDWNEQ